MHILKIRGPRQYTHTYTHSDYATQSTAFRLHPKLSISPNALVYFCHIYLYLPVANVLADFATLHCFERTPQFRYLFFRSLFMHYNFLDCQCATHQTENSKRKKYLRVLAPHQTQATLFFLFLVFFYRRAISRFATQRDFSHFDNCLRRNMEFKSEFSVYRRTGNV